MDDPIPHSVTAGAAIPEDYSVDVHVTNSSTAIVTRWGTILHGGGSATHGVDAYEFTKVGLTPEWHDQQRQKQLEIVETASVAPVAVTFLTVGVSRAVRRKPRSVADPEPKDELPASEPEAR